MGNSYRRPSPPPPRPWFRPPVPTPVEACPSGTVAIQGDGKKFGIQGGPIYSKSGHPTASPYAEVKSMAGCKAKCDYFTNNVAGRTCRAFTFNRRTVYMNVCTLYGTNGPVRYLGSRSNARTCKVPDAVVYKCPPGTSQQGAPGKYGKGASVLQEITDDLQNIDECEKRCCDQDGCLAFIFDDNPDFCILLTSESAAVVTNYGPTDLLGNSVLCTLDNDGDECPAEGECPNGSEKIGETGQRYSGQLVGTFSYKTVEECEEQCRCNEDCFVFSYDDNVNGKSVCKLFQTGSMGGNWPSYGIYAQYAEEITCAVQVCPDGSSQVGAIGTRLLPQDLITAARGVSGPGSCMEKCEETNGCVAFTFDYDPNPRYYGGWFWRRRATDNDGGSNKYDQSADNGCWLYDGVAQSSSRYSRGVRDAITCELDGDGVGSSAQSGYLNFEAITNEAGQGSSDMSVYIIYAVMALILVNIICLIINCWNKKRGNSKRYKVVSMRSDEEITDA